MMGSIVRWTLLVFGLLLALLSLFTTIRAPIWINWQLRCVLAIVAAEAGLILSILPIATGTPAWFLRRPSSYITAATIDCCALAILLMLKPTAQAMRLGRDLPGQLQAAFGPAQVSASPFSIAATFAAAPAQVPEETMSYSGVLKLDFYPAAAASVAPCVIVIHGGSWRAGNRGELAAFNRRLAHLGYAVAAIDYRLAPAAIWPAQREDVLAAIAFLRSKSDTLRIDPNRLVLLGRFAGSQIALATAYTAHDRGIRGVIGFYSPTDLVLDWQVARASDSFPHHQVVQEFLGGTPVTAGEAFVNASPALIVSPIAPATLLIQGQLDSIVAPRQSEILNHKLALLRVPHELLMLPWATHGFDYVPNGPGGQLSAYAVEWFLAAVAR